VTAPARALGTGRRHRVGGRASFFRITAARLLAAVGLLASAAALYGVTASAAFEVDRVEVTGTAIAAPDAVRETVATALGSRPNLFRIRSADVAAALGDVPAVRDARVTVVLPGTVRVAVTERSPIVAWHTEQARLLADVEGRLFMPQPLDATTPGVVTIRDRREAATSFALGSWLDPVDLAVVRQLGALSPKDVGSKARSLELTVNDSDGWVLTAQPKSWRAVFGFYTSRTRRPELVPAQVQCLRALIAASEKQVDTVYLGRPGERCGTFRPRPRP
jgi:cell division septal protein FtsQ